MGWWKDNNMRLVQTNLRETDGNLDVDELFDRLERYAANTLLVNAGGIVSFYPTNLKYQYRAPNQNQDLLEKVIKKAKESNIKVMARFDFSKAQEQLFAEHPEWFYRTYDGKEVNYHGIVHTCLNGAYQREYSLKIIDEVISNYDVNGIFFNMFGYQTMDYSGNHYGRCYCDNCKTRFKEKYNMNLPTPSETSRDVLDAYRAFQKETTEEMLDHIYDLVKNKRPDVAIATYHHHKVDIVMNESNTALYRPLPKWIYSASENIKSVEDSWEDKVTSNICINAHDLSHRFVGVSKHEVAIRLYQNIASGSGLSFCIIGVFTDYPDMEHEKVVEHIYRFHQKNEKYYGNLKSIASIALVKPTILDEKQRMEYSGIFKMLKESHQQFDVIQQHRLLNQSHMSKYRVIILPHIKQLDDLTIQHLIHLQKKGISIIATGAFCQDALQSLFSVNKISRIQDTHASYLDTSDETMMKSFSKRKRVSLEGDFFDVDFHPDTKTLLNFITPAVYGPPERSGGNQATTIPGLGIYRQYQADHAYFPWELGRLYSIFGFEDYKNVLLDVMRGMGVHDQIISTDAHPSVEVFLNQINEKQYLLQTLNLSGFNGMTYTEPIEQPSFSVNMKGIGNVSSIKDLGNDQTLPFLQDDEMISIEVDKLKSFKAMLIQTE